MVRIVTIDPFMHGKWYGSYRTVRHALAHLVNLLLIHCNRNIKITVEFTTPEKGRTFV